MSNIGLQGSVDTVRSEAVAKRVDTRESIAGAFGHAAFYGLVLLTLAAAIPYGTVDPWAKAAFVVLAALLGMVRVIAGLLGEEFRVASGGLLGPLVAILVFAGLQLIPLPSTGAPISVDPYETKTFILVFGSLVICYEALLALTTSARRLKLLVVAVLTVAFASAAFGILRDALLSGWDIFGSYADASQSYAQFINRNHFATLAVMALGLMIGILLKAEVSTKVKIAGWLGAVALLFSIIASSSRGGILSATGLVLFAVFFHILTRAQKEDRQKRRTAREPGNANLYLRRVVWAAASCILVFGLIAFVVAYVGGDYLVNRFEKIDREIQTTDSLQVNRALIWNSTLDLIRAHPITGTGFGAYEAAIPAFDASNGTFRVSQAHNDYLEILANGGVVGFALFAIFAVLATARILRNLRSRNQFRRACCFGAAIGIFGVLIHALVDFGFHTIVNAYVLVLLLTIGTARSSLGTRDEGRGTRDEGLGTQDQGPATDHRPLTKCKDSQPTATW